MKNIDQTCPKISGKKHCRQMFSKENKGSQSVEDINFHDCCLLLFYFIVLHPT